MGKHVFISYSHRDRPYVDSLAAHLRGRGLQVWFDFHVENGHPFSQRIERAIDTCFAFVIVLTPDAYQSEWVRNELARAKRLGKPIQPLLLRDGPRPLEVDGLHLTGVIGGQLPPQRFITTLLGLGSAVAPPPPALPLVTPPGSVPESPDWTRLHWALLSRRPGRSEDYRIVGSSFDGALASRLLRTAVDAAGDVLGLSGRASPPWYTILPGPAEDTLALVAIAPGQARDATNRVVAPARLLVLPRHPRDGQRVSFTAAARLLSSLQWEAVDVGPPDSENHRSLPVPAVVSDNPLPYIEAIGLDWAAGVAAALFEGESVVITAEDLPSPIERLAVLDAVWALLPETYVSRLSAATWVSARSRHSLDLTFAAHAQRGQLQVVFGSSGPGHSLGDTGKAYADTLVRLSKRVPLAQIVDHLGTAGASDTDRVEAALIALVEIDLPAAVHGEIREGKASVARVSQLLSRQSWSDLDRELQQDLLRFLGGQLLGVDPLAVDQARELLQANWSSQAAAVLSREAAAVGPTKMVEAIQIWAGLLGPDAAMDLMRATATLTAERAQPSYTEAFAGLLWTEPLPGLGRLEPETLRILLHQPSTASQLLTAMLREQGGYQLVRRIIELVRPIPSEMPIWAKPVAAAITSEQASIEPLQLEAMRAAWPDGIVAVVRATANRGELITLPGAVWHELILYTANPRTDGEGYQDLVALLRDLAIAGGAEGDAVGGDLLGLIALQRLPALARWGHQAPRVYLDAMRRLLSDPALYQDQRTLAASAAIALSTSPTPNSMTSLMLIADAVEQTAQTPAVDAVRSYLESDPTAFWALETPGEWPARLGGWVPTMVQLKDQINRDAENSAVSRSFQQGFNVGTPILLTEFMMTQWLKRVSPMRVVDMVLLLDDANSEALTLLGKRMARLSRVSGSHAAVSAELATRRARLDRIAQQFADVATDQPR